MSDFGQGNIAAVGTDFHVCADPPHARWKAGGVTIDVSVELVVDKMGADRFAFFSAVSDLLQLHFLAH